MSRRLIEVLCLLGSVGSLIMAMNSEEIRVWLYLSFVLGFTAVLKREYRRQDEAQKAIELLQEEVWQRKEARGSEIEPEAKAQTKEREADTDTSPQ